MSSPMFYVQDSRSYVGNDILWWAKGSQGYTTNLLKAQLYTLEEAQAIHNGRSTDIPWPQEYIEVRTRPAVDMQYCDRGIALRGSGIVIRKPPKTKAQMHNCGGCGKFIRQRDLYGNCPHCGYDNCP